MTATLPRVLIVAGSDSGGGAGIQADIKTVTALGGYAMTAITAITVQDTLGVHGIHAVPNKTIAAQMRVVLADIGADAVKTGMLHDRGVIETVAREYDAGANKVPLIVDPVMVAKGGARLVDDTAIDAVRTLLLPRAAIVTPNIPEAEALTGLVIRSIDDMKRAGEKLLAMGTRAALVKGGHRDGAVVTDVLVSQNGTLTFESPRIDTVNTHGTGCTLASAIATGLAQKMSLPDAVARARAYVLEAIRTAPGLGHGHGPLNHMHSISRAPK